MTSYAQIAANNAQIEARNKARKPGPQTPQKYPVAPGPNYAQYGEQSGYIYNPYTDHYVPDPKVAGPYYGQPDPVAPPGLAEQIGKPAAILGTAALATEGAKALPSVFSGGGAAATTATPGGAGLLGIGGTASPTALAAPNIIGASPVAGGAPVAATGGIAANAAGLGIGPLALLAGGTYLGGKSAWDELHGNTDNSIPGIGGRVILGMATGGLSEIARPFLKHESTQDYQNKNTSGLMGIGADDATWQNYLQGARAQNIAGGPTDPSKPFFNGKYDNFEDYKKAGLDATDLSGVYANLDKYGPGWAKLTDDQRKAVTQKNIDSGIYDSHKGEIVFTDPNVAQQNYDSVVGGAQPVVAVPAPAATPVVQLPGQRTTTLSPGIGLNGQRINYLR